MDDEAGGGACGNPRVLIVVNEVLNSGWGRGSLGKGFRGIWGHPSGCQKDEDRMTAGRTRRSVIRRNGMSETDDSLNPAGKGKHGE